MNGVYYQGILERNIHFKCEYCQEKHFCMQLKCLGSIEKLV